MEISDFDKSKIPIEELRLIEKDIGDHLKLLSLDDKFHFTCARCNRCCRRRPDEVGFTIPHLYPYDIIRLSRSLKITTTEFLKRYTNFEQLNPTPIIAPFLKFIGDEQEMKCPFLDDSGCSVHEDRPMICRLYPLGRFSSSTRALITMPKRLHDCFGGSGQEHTVRSWLDKSGVLNYFKYDKFDDLFSNMDLLTFFKLPQEQQDFFYTTLYDIDWILVKFGYGGLSDPAEEIVDVCYDFCRRLLKVFDRLQKSEGDDDGKN